LDTKGNDTLDGISIMRRVGIPYSESYTLAIKIVGIPHPKSYTLATIMVEIMMLTYTNGKFICKLHRKKYFN
jgi:hypothetical protein